MQLQVGVDKAVYIPYCMYVSGAICIAIQFDNAEREQCLERSNE